MEEEKWKNLLLNWIDHTGIIPVTAESQLNIEDTDIRTFFEEFLKLLKITEFSSAQICHFLKVNYPDFELTSSGDDLPPRRDFMLVYSILLHYGCITCLDKSVQRSSESLSAAEQLAVTVFLNHFLARNVTVTRAALSLAIRDAVQSMDARPLDENGNRGDIFSTPKTVKLEQNYREIYRLRGQVDTVAYEMSYMEGLVRERDNHIDRLKQREVELQREIEELKKTIVGHHRPENGDENQRDELARKERAELRQLRRNNGQLEDKVSNLLIEVNNVTNDKLKLIGKLKTSAKELKTYREREAELATLIEELNVDVAEKSRRITDLLEANMELESYISENKSLWNKNIDTTMNGSSSANSSSTNLLLRSANLGSCVIDIQLKEKELENAELKAQLVSLHDQSMGMQRGMERFLEENAAFRDQCSNGCGQGGGVSSSTSWHDKVPEFFQALTQLLREKAQLESTVQGQVTVMLRFREERDRLRDELTAQTEKGAVLERELVGLRETVRSYAETERKELDTFKYEVKHLNDLMTVQKLEKESFRSAIEKGEEDVYARIRKIAKLNLVIEKLRFEKKRADHEHAEAEANLNRVWGIRVEEARDQLGRRLEEQRVAKEEGERRAAEREEMLKKEGQRLREMVERLEKETGELRRDKANLETKIQIVSQNLRQNSAEEKKMMVLDSDAARERARRSSLLCQWTSTPRLSMKQKVRLDAELMKRRRISLLSPDDDNMTSSESDNNAYCTPVATQCPCQGSQQQQPGIVRASQKLRLARRDSLTFHSPGRKKRSSQVVPHPSKAVYDRTTINRLQKQKRQKIFNTAREALRESEPTTTGSTQGGGGGGGSTQVDSLLWDGQFDLMDLEGGAEDFGANNEEMRQNFHEILQLERCDGEDLFKGQPLTPKSGSVSERKGDEGDDDEIKGDEMGQQRLEVSIERRAEEGEVPLLLRNSFERSGASTIQSKSYSMNSGVYWGNERIPTASVVHFSPRSERVTISPQRKRGGGGGGMIGRWNDLNVIPMSQQNLLQLIAIVLIGIFVCIVFQGV